MSLDVGRMRHRVIIQRRDAVTDSDGSAQQDPTTGEVEYEWVSLGEVWASIEPLSVREFIQSQATQSQITARITIRQRDDIDASCRLLHVRLNRPTVIYGIVGPLADLFSGLEYLTMPCTTLGVLDEDAQPLLLDGLALELDGFALELTP